MNILHYTLGFPPFRTGGLTKYAMDLIHGQVINGYKVGMLWPGRMHLIDNKLRIKKTNYTHNIESYELINPLPVPLLNGIQNVYAYTKKTETSLYKKFLLNLKPDVVHIHTLMGIHREFFEVVKELGIKMVFTSHDYFGICPKVNLFYKSKSCLDSNYKNCVKCNESAISSGNIKFLQSGIYRKLKYSGLMTIVRNKYKVNHKSQNSFSKKRSKEVSIKQEHYKQLREYYISIFNMIDKFHFNSTVSQSVYLKYMPDINNKIIPITHEGIKDLRKEKKFIGKLKITYLGPTQRYKGFNLLKKVLDDIYLSGNKDLILNVFSNTNEKSPYMSVQSGYKYTELEEIFKNTDILVAPSLWKETFGFVVLEALSFGVPVLVTENVGSKDLITSGETGYIIKPTYFELKNAIIRIYNNRHSLNNINKNIQRMTWVPFMDHITKITDFYTEKDSFR